MTKLFPLKTCIKFCSKKYVCIYPEKEILQFKYLWTDYHSQQSKVITKHSKGQKRNVEVAITDSFIHSHGKFNVVSSGLQKCYEHYE